MSNYKDELVDIYAHRLSEINDSQEYQKLCDQHGKNFSFNCFRKNIEQIKKQLEVTVEIQTSEKREVSESLRIMNKVKKDKNKEILDHCRKLIIKAYSENWSPEQLDYFEKISNKLTTPDHDYFLSFTRRKRSGYGYNRINKNYEYFIKDTLGEHSFIEEERIKKNLLARSIHSILTECGYNGFFYPEHSEDNQPVGPKLERECKNSLIFIQLIQNVMFDKTDGENYCFTEYKYARDTFFSEEEIIFVLAEASYEKFCEIKDDVCLDYQVWYEHVLNKDIVSLGFTTTRKQKDIDLLKKKIEDKICNKIREYKDNLCENVP
jgi:hypothetical protein